MKIKGERFLDHSIESVYGAASDLEGLASEFPQVSNVEVIGTGAFRITINLDFKIYSGAYFADLKITDALEPNEFSVVGHHKSKLGNMRLNCKTMLTSENSKRTFVSMQGDFSMSGMLRFANKKIVRKGVEFGIKLMLDTIDRRALLYRQEI